MELSETAQRILERKYLRKDSNGKPLEDYDGLCMRVALYITSNEERDRSFWVNTYYNLMKEQWFIPGGRILSNAGLLKNGNLYNCYVLGLEDSRDSIYTTLKEAAEIFAHGGGVGFNFSKLREYGSPVSNGSIASGPVSFINLFNASADVISQASRRGAQMGILNIDHPDIFEFVCAKASKKNLQHFNISVGITDKFMEAVKRDGEFQLISRYTRLPVKTVRARDLLYEISRNAYNTGDPGVIFIDSINRGNSAPHLGGLETTNPCLDKSTIMLDGDNLCEINKVKTFTVWRTGIRKTIKLITNAGHELILTPEHKILLEDGNFIEAKDSLGKHIVWALGDRMATRVTKNSIIAGILFGLSVSNKSKQNIMMEKFLKRFESREVSPINDFSKEVFFGNTNFSGGFLKGFFEAAGTVNDKGQIVLNLENKKILKELQILLASFGIRSYIKENILTINKDAKKFVEKIGLISLAPRNKIAKKYQREDPQLIVEKIETWKETEVWDFNVSGSIGFANGIIVHNCGEIPLFPGEACCLGSVNLAKMVKGEFGNYEVDFEKLFFTVSSAIRFLDSVHDVHVPVLSSNSTKLTRKIGLGVMGWADLLAMLKIPYNSEEALNLATKVGGYMKKVAYETSCVLATVNGPHACFDPSSSVNVWFPEMPVVPIRNASLLAFAPTGTISLLAGVNSSIEPFFALAYRKRVTEGEKETLYTIYTVNNLLKKYLEMFDEEIQRKTIEHISVTGTIADAVWLPEDIRGAFKISHDLTPEEHIMMQSAWQKNVDSSISKTINMPSNSTVEDIMEAIKLGWEIGLKGMTLYRDRCREDQIMTVGA